MARTRKPGPPLRAAAFGFGAVGSAARASIFATIVCAVFAGMRRSRRRGLRAVHDLEHPAKLSNGCACVKARDIQQVLGGRKFNEALNENPGEHFTPRHVVHLMVDLLPVNVHAWGRPCASAR